MELLNTTEDYDILLLDIKLDSGNDGIKLGQQLNNVRNPTPLIILVTSLSDRVFDGYSTKAHRYITKPIDYGTFNEAIVSAIEELQNYKKRLEIMYGQTTYYIPIHTIEYIEGFKKHKEIHAKGKEYPAYDNWEDILLKLPTSQFFQLHQSFCINLDLVNSVHQAEVVMKSGKKIPIARSKKKELTAALNSFLEV